MRLHRHHRKKQRQKNTNNQGGLRKLKADRGRLIHFYSAEYLNITMSAIHIHYFYSAGIDTS